jgi:hypothetical protein
LSPSFLRCILCLVLSILAAALLIQGAPLPRAHAHNDYNQPVPLFGALAQGFCSVEADVFLVDGKLLVGHERKELTPSRELSAMYLEPLGRMIEANGGNVYSKPAEVILLVDIKTDGAAVYEELKRLLKPHERYLTRFRDGKVHLGAITIILSGERPIDLLAKEQDRYAFIDGRPSDLGKSEPSLMPLISTSWTTEFKWRGEGDMPSDERARLGAMVDLAHRNRQKLRFWATPEDVRVWNVLRDAGVDLIGTDQQESLAEFLRRG